MRIEAAAHANSWSVEAAGANICRPGVRPVGSPWLIGICLVILVNNLPLSM